MFLDDFAIIFGGLATNPLDFTLISAIVFGSMDTVFGHFGFIFGVFDF